AHELRTPLALARGYLDMVRTQSLGAISGPAGEALAIADAKLGDIDELAAQMVQMARLQGGQSELRLELLDVRELAGEALDRSRPLATDGHRLVLVQPEQPVLAVAGRPRLRVL